MKQCSRRNAFRPHLEWLEDRCLLAAPVLSDLPASLLLNIPVGKTLALPLAGLDPAGGTVSYNVQSNQADVTVSQRTGAFLKLSVAGFGDLEFELFGDLTPKTVATISGLVNSEFYDGLTFHRVVNNFAIQGGDPNGNGSGGPGFKFDDEFNPDAIFTGSGQLAMANSGKDTNGSQFFISIGAQRSLDFNHTIFGQLVRGFDVMDEIAVVPVGAQNPNDPSTEFSKPLTPIIITSARIVQDPSAAVFTLKSTGTTPESLTLTVTATSSTGGSTVRSFTASVVQEKNDFHTSLPFNDPPILGPIGDQVAPAGQSLQLNLTAIDLEGQTPTFEAQVISPASGVTATVAGNVVTVNPGTFTGPVTLKVGASDPGAGDRNSAADPFDTQQITIGFGDQALTVGSAVGVAATEGKPATNVQVATFTDADLSAVPADFRVVINWGDEKGLDLTTGTVTGSNGNFSVTGTHTYREAGKFPVQVTITDVHTSGPGGDNGGAVLKVTNIATVADAGLTAHATAIPAMSGIPFNGAVATFTDADPAALTADFTATINWGDGTSSTGKVSATGNGSFVVSGSHIYGNQGSFTVAVAIQDINTSGDVTGASASVQSVATVTPGSFLDRVYQNILDRAVDDAGRTYFNGLLAMGVPRSVVVLTIENSLEGRVHQVERLFQRFLGRSADMGSMVASVNFLANGGTVRQLTSILLGTQEYFDRRGGGTNSGFLTALFHDLLSADIPAEIKKFIDGQMAKGATREAIALEVLTAPVTQTAQRQASFARFFSRPANAAELLLTAQVVNQAARALHRFTIDELDIAFILGNDEMFLHG